MNSENIKQQKTLTNNYSLYGLTVSFPFPCPGFESSEQKPDATVKKGIIHADSIAWTDQGGCFKVSPDCYLLSVPNIASFLVSKGVEIIVEAKPEVDEETLLLFLVHEVLGALLHQRNHLVLQGSAMEKDGKVFALLGESGVGKSLLAAAMQEKGYRMFTDAICSITAQEELLIHPGHPFLLLWKDSLKMLKKEDGNYRAVRKELNKFWVPVEAHDKPSPRPLKTIFILNRSNCEKPATEEIYGFKKVFALRSSVYHTPLIDGMGQQRYVFQQCEMLSRHVAVIKLDIPTQVTDIAEVADDLDQKMRELKQRSVA